ncbi:MAG TPA: hypothetical protein VKJ47_02745 [Candidatus Binatia bacterium]|nr:hypothetical protein [Candidatus Binatia bacterium]
MSERRTTNVLLLIIAALLGLITLRLYGAVGAEKVYAAGAPASAPAPTEVFARAPLPVQAKDAPLAVALYYQDHDGSWRSLVGPQGTVPTARYAQ